MKLNTPPVAVTVCTLIPFMYKVAVALAVVVPEMVLVAVVKTVLDGAVITGTANAPASALPPLPAAQK